MPLSTVLCNPDKLDFNFKLDRPLALPAYRVLDDEIYFKEGDDLEEEKLRKNEQLCTYLNVSISLDPAIELPSENIDSYYPGGEPSLLLIMANDWLIHLRNKLKTKRNFQVFGENLNGQSILLCRYLRPLEPPKGLTDLTANDPYAIEKCARFVSMIPFMTDLSMFKNDLPDMYSTC